MVHAAFEKRMNKGAARFGLYAAVALMAFAPLSLQAAELSVTANRATLVESPRPMGEVIVADPSIADVNADGGHYLSVIGKRPGVTTLRIFDRDRKLIQSYDVHVGYDLVEIRRALKNFLPNETIGVETVGGQIALTGNISSAEASDQAVRIVSEILRSLRPQPQTVSVNSAVTNQSPVAVLSKANEGVLNLMKITSGQQVMLRVRVGEIQRTALKDLGIDLQDVSATGSALAGIATGGGIASLVSPGQGQTATPLGQYLLPGGAQPTNTRGILFGRWQPNGANGTTLSGLLHALEQDGLFKLLAEPNLVAVSGQEAQFLAGGEIPIPVPQASGGISNTITIEYKPYGVAIRFRPQVLSGNRINMDVQPEVSELDPTNALTLNGFTVPALTTRRAKTTVELAPGESFMIAGLIKDESRSTINQLPGVKELPILGALFRSTNFQRNETELVIAVTPYTVDPMRSSDVRLPTDNFAPASQMEMFFYGALGSLVGGKAPKVSQTPSVEGPIGFMVD